jgi:hypothetical protein
VRQHPDAVTRRVDEGVGATPAKVEEHVALAGYGHVRGSQVGKGYRGERVVLLGEDASVQALVEAIGRGPGLLDQRRVKEGEHLVAL